VCKPELKLFSTTGLHFSGRTEEALAAALLDDLDDAGLELLNRRHVVGENAHLA
jgi:hypothetical protein